MDFTDLATRVRQGIDRHQVVLGREQFNHYVRSSRLGAVWVTEDLGHTQMNKMRTECREFKLHLIVGGDSAELEAITRCENAKVFLLKKGFAGLNTILRAFPDGSQE